MESNYQKLIKKEEEFLKAFGKKVKLYRHLKDYSQLDLSLESGLDRNYIGGIERGKRNISIIKVKQLADALDINVKDLFD